MALSRLKTRVRRQKNRNFEVGAIRPRSALSKIHYWPGFGHTGVCYTRHRWMRGGAYVRFVRRLRKIMSVKLGQKRFWMSTFTSQFFTRKAKNARMGKGQGSISGVRYNIPPLTPFSWLTWLKPIMARYMLDWFSAKSSHRAIACTRYGFAYSGPAPVAAYQWLGSGGRIRKKRKARRYFKKSRFVMAKLRLDIRNRKLKGRVKDHFIWFFKSLFSFAFWFSLRFPVLKEPSYAYWAQMRYWGLGSCPRPVGVLPSRQAGRVFRAPIRKPTGYPMFGLSGVKVRGLMARFTYALYEMSGGPRDYGWPVKPLWHQGLRWADVSTAMALSRLPYSGALEGSLWPSTLFSSLGDVDFLARVMRVGFTVGWMGKKGRNISKTLRRLVSSEVGLLWMAMAKRKGLGRSGGSRRKGGDKIGLWVCGRLNLRGVSRLRLIYASVFVRSRVRWVRRGYRGGFIDPRLTTAPVWRVVVLCPG